MGLQDCSSNNWYQSEKILETYGDGGAIPLKPTTVAATNSMRCGGRRRVLKAVGGAKPLAAGRGAMLQGGDGGAIPLRRYTAA